jgi:hypothetical protein
MSQTYQPNNPEHSYNGNTQVKCDGVTYNYTEWEAAEYLKCMTDVEYFARNYIKVINLDKGLCAFEPYGYQKQMLQHYSANRFSIVLSCRQSGKSVTSIVWLIWYAIFNPEKTIAILANKRATANEMLSRITLALENLPFFLQPGCKVLNKGSIVFSNNTKIFSAATTSSSVRGQSCVTGDTMVTVLTDNGDRSDIRIDAITKEHTYVLTRFGFKRFDKLLNQGIKRIVKLLLTDGTFIRCTPDHRVYTSDRNSFVEVISLLPNEKLLDRTVDRVEQLYEVSAVYDLQNVADTNAYLTNGIVSHNCNVIFLDEFAFVQNAHDFYTSTYPVISSGKDTKVIITSTPNGIGNLFHQLWESAVQNRSLYKPLKVNWWDVPGRDEAWMRETIANTSQRKFDQEYSVRFLGSSSTLVDPDNLFAIKASEPIATRRNGLFKAFKQPTQGHAYVMTVDVAQGRGQDYSTFTIFDTSVMPYEQVATFRDNMISPIMYPDVIVRFAKEYNEALVIIENNDAGKVVCNGVYYEHEYENTFVQSSSKAGGIGVTMSKLVKRVGCSNLKDLVELGKLVLHDAESISELSAFEVKDNSYGGKDGVHDDLVMNLVMFAWFVSTDGFGYTALSNLREVLYADRVKEMEDDIAPLGIIGNADVGYIHPDIQRAINDAKEWHL